MRKLKAIDRILIDEIGYRFIDNKIKKKILLGCYEHFYNDNFKGTLHLELTMLLYHL